MNHISVGVYASGSHVVNVVRPEHLEQHIEYNLTFRPGRAFFVDGVCVNKGYLNDEGIAEWEKKIKEMNINTAHSSEKYM